MVTNTITAADDVVDDLVTAHPAPTRPRTIGELMLDLVDVVPESIDVVRYWKRDHTPSELFKAFDVTEHDGSRNGCSLAES